LLGVILVSGRFVFTLLVGSFLQDLAEFLGQVALPRNVAEPLRRHIGVVLRRIHRRVEPFKLALEQFVLCLLVLEEVVPIVAEALHVFGSQLRALDLVLQVDHVLGRVEFVSFLQDGVLFKHP